MRVSQPANGQDMFCKQPKSDPHADPTKMPRMSSPMSFLKRGAFLLAVSMLSIAQTGTAVLNDNACVCNYDAETDYFPIKLTAEYATGFSIEYYKSYKKITAMLHGQPYVTYAYLCGTPPPPEASGDSLVMIPVNTSAITSSTILPLVEYVGARESLLYIAESEQNLPSCLRVLYENNLLLTPGINFNYTLADLAPEINQVAESLTGKKLNVIFMDYYTFEGYYGPTNTSAEYELIFGSGTQSILIAETLETSPLAIIEWTKVLGAYYNQEAAAQYAFSSIVARYNCVSNLVVANPPAQKMKVLWGSWEDYGYATNYSLATCPNYYCDFIANAGGEILTAPAEYLNNYALNDTQFYEWASQADVWIYVDGNFNMDTEYQGPFYTGERAILFASLPVIKNKMVFDILGSNINEWFEAAQAEPDVVLMDLEQALYGTTYIGSDRAKVFLRNVFTEPAAYQGPAPTIDCENLGAALYTDWLEGPCYVSGSGVEEGIEPVLCNVDSHSSSMQTVPSFGMISAVFFFVIVQLLM